MIYTGRLDLSLVKLMHLIGCQSTKEDNTYFSVKLGYSMLTNHKELIISKVDPSPEVDSQK